MGLGKRFLVTGGNGQLGRAFSSSLTDADVLDRASLDIADRDSVLRTIEELKPSIVINAAAYTKVDAAEQDEGNAHRINVEGPRFLAEAVAATGALLVHVSTDYVFPGESPRPYLEDDQTAPKSVYGRTKLEGEAEAAAVESLIVRTSWVFGDGPNFIRAIIGAAQKHDELSVVDDQVGLPTYAVDLAAGIIGLIDAGARGTYHLAGGGEPGTWAELAELALSTKASPTRIKHVSTADYFAGKPGPIAERPSFSVLDCTKAATLGVKLRPWRQSVVEYVNTI